MERLNKKLIMFFTILIIGVIGFATSFNSVFTRIDAGQYKVIQSVKGNVYVLDKPGWHFTGMRSNMTTYDIAGRYYFSSSDLDGGNGRESDPIQVRFKDSTMGMVNGNIQFRLPVSNETRIELHELYGRSYNELIHNLIRNSTQEAIGRSATYFTAEEVLTSSAEDFVRMMDRQLKEGIFAQEKSSVKRFDEDGNEYTEVQVSIRKDKNGNDIISNESRFKKFGVEIIGLTILKTEPDDRAKALLEKKKESEYKKIIQRQEAEEAKQRKITAELTAAANVEEARGKEEIAKMAAITEAEKNNAVAKLNADKDFYTAQKNREIAAENAKSLILTGEAQAKTNELLVKAGLSPKEKALIDKETKIGVARELSKVAVPSIVVGGDGKNNANDLVGIKFLLDVSEKLGK